MKTIFKYTLLSTTFLAGAASASLRSDLPEGVASTPVRTAASRILAQQDRSPSTPDQVAALRAAGHFAVLSPFSAEAAEARTKRLLHKGNLQSAQSQRERAEREAAEAAEADRITAFNARMEELRRDNTSQDTTITQMRQQIRDLRDELTSSQTRIEELEGEIRTLEEMSTRQAAHLEEVQRVNQEEAASFGARRTELEAQLATLRGQMEDSETQSHESQTALRAEIAALERTIEEQIATLSRREQIVRDLQQECDATNREYEEVRSQLLRITAEREAKEQALRAFEAASREIPMEGRPAPLDIQSDDDDSLDGEL